MTPHSPPESFTMRPMHPLATSLAARLHSGARVLDVGRGSGRNAAGLRGAGLSVESLEDGQPVSRAGDAFDAAVSTHALLHGSGDDVAQLLAAIAAALKPNAPFHACFGSRSDARFGVGTRIDERTFAASSGDEAGVAHVFFTAGEVRALLEPEFTIDSLAECDVDDVAGSWAHARQPLQGARHWFVTARRTAG